MFRLPLYLAVSLTTVLLAGGCSPLQPETFPNIIYILADDLGYGDLSALNRSSKIPTPAMDRIAHEGITFTDAHSPSAVCTPTRYGVLTGQYCFRTSLKSGVLVGYSPQLIDHERLTVAELLQRAGYHTACIGKWHLGLDWPKKDSSMPLIDSDGWGRTKTSNINYEGYVGGPNEHGFDYSFIIPASLDIIPYVYIRDGRLTGPVNDTIAGCNDPRGVFWRPGDIQEGFKLEETLPVLTDEAVGFILKQKETDAPFFLYFPLTAPHTPWLPAEEFAGSSNAGIYGDFVCEVDHMVGRVLDALVDIGKADHTIVILTSDNGSHWTPNDIALWNHHANAEFRGMKSDVWEGGHHVPFLVRWPKKIKAGQITAEVTCLTDLMATCAELTRQELTGDNGQDSYSMLPVLLGAQYTSPIRNHTIHHSVSGVFAIRAGDWKFIDHPGSGGWSYPGTKEDAPGQLYNMVTDRGETSNLFVDEPEIVRMLKDKIEDIKR